MGGLRIWHWIVVGAVFLVLIGGRRNLIGILRTTGQRMSKSRIGWDDLLIIGIIVLIAIWANAPRLTTTVPN